MSDDVTIEIDMNQMTIGEMIDIEEITGEPIGAMSQAGAKGKALSAKSMLAVVYISMRRNDPKFTLEDAKALDISTIKFANGENDEEGNALAD